MNPLTTTLLDVLQTEAQKLTERALEMGIGYALDVLEKLDSAEVIALTGDYNSKHALKMGLRDILSNGRPGNVLDAAVNMAHGIAHEGIERRNRVIRDRMGQQYLDTRLDVTIKRIRAGVAHLVITDPTTGTYDAQLTYGDTTATKAMLWQTFIFQNYYGDDGDNMPRKFDGLKLRMSRWQAIELVKDGQLIGPESMLPMKPESED